MPPLRSRLRPGPMAVAVAAVDMWRRLSPAQRRQIVAVVRRHGPTVVAKAAELRKKSRRP